MTDQDHWKRDMQPRIVDEVDYIRAAFKKKGIGIGVVPERHGLGYMYAVGQLLVRERYLDGVLRSLRRQGVRITPGEPERGEPQQGESPRGEEGGGEPPRGEFPEDEFPRVLPGLILLHFSGKSVPEVLEVIDRDLGEGCATPNHVLTVAGETSPCPATDPEEVYEGTEPYPGVCQCNSGAGVRVYVADTGLLPDAESHPWLAGVTGDEFVVAVNANPVRMGLDRHWAMSVPQWHRIMIGIQRDAELARRHRGYGASKIVGMRIGLSQMLTFFSEQIDRSALGLSVDALVGDAIEPDPGGGLHRTQIAQLQSAQKILFDVADSRLDPTFFVSPANVAGGNLKAMVASKVRVARIEHRCDAGQALLNR